MYKLELLKDLKMNKTFEEHPIDEDALKTEMPFKGTSVFGLKQDLPERHIHLTEDKMIVKDIIE